MQVSLSQTRLKAGLTREQIFTCQKKFNSGAITGAAEHHG